MNLCGETLTLDNFTLKQTANCVNELNIDMCKVLVFNSYLYI